MVLVSFCICTSSVCEDLFPPGFASRSKGLTSLVFVSHAGEKWYIGKILNHLFPIASLVHFLKIHLKSIYMFFLIKCRSGMLDQDSEGWKMAGIVGSEKKLLEFCPCYHIIWGKFLPVSLVQFLTFEV